MRIYKQLFKSVALTTLLFAGFAAFGIAQDTTTIEEPETKAPVITSTTPSGGEMNVGLGSVIEITFSSDMDEETINGTTLVLHATYTDEMYEGHSEVMMDDQIKDGPTVNNSKNSSDYTGAVNGTISYSNKIAVFTPDQGLKEGILYTFTVTTGVKDLEDIPLENAQTWSFTTTGTADSAYSDKQNDRYSMVETKNQTETENQSEAKNQSEAENQSETENQSMYATSTEEIESASSPEETKIIDLGKAGHFVILAKKDVNNESGSKITGQVGDGSKANKTQKEKVTLQSATGQNSVTQSNQSDTTSADINEGIKDMMSAYADASLQNGLDLTTHENGSFNNTVLTPGVHEWSDSLHIASDVTLSGSADDVWLFKASKNLTVQENTVFTLTDGAQADNVFWYVEGEVNIGENAHFEGIILSMNEITLEKGAKLNGRMFSQKSITLDDNTVTEPRGMTGQTTSKNK